MATKRGAEMEESVELVVSTAAAVFEPPLQPSGPLSGQAMAKFLHMPSPGYSPDGSLAINSHRDQIEVFLLPSKIDVRNVSGNFEKGYEKVPEVLHGMCELLGADPPKSIGINFVVSVPKDDPEDWIGRRFLNEYLSSTLKVSPASDAISFNYERGNKVITVRFEARPESAITVNFNASEQVTTLPGQAELAVDAWDQWGIFSELLKALDVLS
jgi:hypothetical protein